MSNLFARRAATLFAAAALTTLAACGGADTATAGAAAGTAAGAATGAAASTAALDPILANPQVGDLYAADLTHFSRQPFNVGGSGQAGRFGLLKVVAVETDKVIVITEMGAWPQQDGAINDLGGTLSDISWDESERIDVPRANFAQLVTDGKILRTRRMAAN
jgi:hypothetical protein